MTGSNALSRTASRKCGRSRTSAADGKQPSPSSTGSWRKEGGPAVHPRGFACSSRAVGHDRREHPCCSSILEKKEAPVRTTIPLLLFAGLARGDQTATDDLSWVLQRVGEWQPKPGERKFDRIGWAAD